MAEKTEILTPEQIEGFTIPSGMPSGVVLRVMSLIQSHETLRSLLAARDKAIEQLSNLLCESTVEAGKRDRTIIELNHKALNLAGKCRDLETDVQNRDQAIILLEARARNLEAAARGALGFMENLRMRGTLVRMRGTLVLNALRAALSLPPPPEIPATPCDHDRLTGWASCAERMPEDNVNVLWARVPVEEPYYFGSMCDDDYGGADYYTHWLDPKYIPQPPPPAAGQAAAVPGKMNP